MLVLPVFAGSVTAQSETNYYVTVKPTTPNLQMYTTVGHNWALTFSANWTYGANSGTPVENATAYIEVKNSGNKVLEALTLNTTTGIFSFNYSTTKADILTFTPIGLTTQNDETYTDEIKDSDVSGFKAESAVVWFDTFHVGLVSWDTGSLGKASVTVNVTYLLLPEEGLTLPEWATYSNQTFLPKILHDAPVTINGVVAQETDTQGIYRAESSIAFPTTYAIVKVTQEGWTTTSTAFSFTHAENLRVWSYAIIFGSALTLVALILQFISSKRANNSGKSKLFVGAVLLAVTSIISLYWGLVGLEGIMHGFDWLLLTALGLLSFGFGLACSLLAFKRKYHALAILAVMVPLIVNVVIVKSALDAYMLSYSWLLLALFAGLSILSAYFISNADGTF